MHVLSKKPNLLIFCSLISEAKEVVKRIPGAVLLTSDTKKEERELIYQSSKGAIKCLVNVGVLTTGFDYQN
jgi:DNA repair protein RadD